MEYSSKKSIRVLDLFSGAGGLSYGFLLASSEFQIVGAVEKDPASAATFQQNHPKTELYVGGIEEWLDNEEIPFVDIVVGGPPCQGFSTLGKRDEEDVRNSLWFHYAKAIRASHPKFFVLENVPSFLKSHQFQLFQEQLEPTGLLENYSFQAKILNAADYGTAQLRKRVIVIGHRRGIKFPGFPPPSHSQHGDNGTHPWRTLSDALEGVSSKVTDIELPNRATSFEGRTFPGVYLSHELHLTRNYQPLSRKRFETIPENGNRFDIPDNLLPNCWKKHKSGSGDVMGRLNFAKPTVTIRTEFFKPEKGRYLHPHENRAITHFEASRIQGFPDKHKWVGSKTSIAKQIGNAVPIPLGRAIGQHLLTSINKD